MDFGCNGILFADRKKAHLSSKAEALKYYYQNLRFQYTPEGIEIENEDGRHIAVVINPNEYPIQATLRLGGELYYLDLPTESISTVIVTA